MLYSNYQNLNKYKLLILFLLIIVIASTVTFSLFIRNIYMNMDEIREQEIKFRKDIAENNFCCSVNTNLINELKSNK
jgi:hypothetical protein